MQKILLQVKKYVRMIEMGIIAIIVIVLSVIFAYTYRPASSQNEKFDEELKSRIGSIQLSMADGSKLSYIDWANKHGLTDENNGLDKDPSNSGLPNYLKYVYLTNPKVADPNNKGFTDKQDVADGYDPTGSRGFRPKVQIAIKKIGIDAPMQWNFSSNQESIFIHLDGTTPPGQIGASVISTCFNGRQSKMFDNIKDLALGDVILVKMTENNGRIISFPYVITDKFIAAENDKRIFEASQKQALSLISCLPDPGNNFKKLVVKAQLN